MDEQIVTRVTPVFRRVFKDEKLVLFAEMKADDVARWDSLSHITLIAEIEKEFGVKFKLKELTAMRNVGDLVNNLKQKGF